MNQKGNIGNFGVAYWLMNSLWSNHPCWVIYTIYTQPECADPKHPVHDKTQFSLLMKSLLVYWLRGSPNELAGLERSGENVHTAFQDRLSWLIWLLAFKQLRHVETIDFFNFDFFILSDMFVQVRLRGGSLNRHVSFRSSLLYTAD